MSEVFGLKRNPFPSDAIATQANTDDPFCANLHPRLDSKMAHAFVGNDSLPPPVEFLWSLGEGENSRGYGKTRNLLRFADFVNHDLGQAAIRLAGAHRAQRLVAAYTSFNTADNLSLSNALFDAVRELVTTRRTLLASLREDALDHYSPSELYGATSELLVRDAWSSEFVWLLCSETPERWGSYLNSPYRFRAWHRVRYGKLLLRSVVAFLRVLGVSRLLLLIDQVEDFASYSTPAYKLYRDLPRIADLCTRDAAVGSHLTVVLTMHPLAARVVSWCWPNQLGSLSSDSEESNVVRIDKMTFDAFVELAATYLDSVRLRPTLNNFDPFSIEALEMIYRSNGGRPGYCLSQMHAALELAIDQGTNVIGSDALEDGLEGAN